MAPCGGGGEGGEECMNKLVYNKKLSFSDPFIYKFILLAIITYNFISFWGYKIIETSFNAKFSDN